MSPSTPDLGVPVAPLWPGWLRHPIAFRFVDTLRDCWRDLVERRRFAARALPGTAERILVVRDRGLGDVLQITTILDAIRERYQATRLDFLTGPTAGGLLAADARVDGVLTTRDCPAALADLYDLIINLHIFDNSGEVRDILSACPEEKLLGRTYRVGRDEEWLGYLAGGCWLRKYCRIADVPFQADLPWRIRIAKDAAWAHDRTAFCARYLPAQEARDPLVAVCLGGRDWRRNYSIACVEKILASLERDYRPVLVGLRDDRPEHEADQIAPLVARHPRVLDLTDRLSLREMFFALESCRVLVTCDTGPIHMAIGVGTPVVALFGHTPGTQLLGPRRRSDRHAILTPARGCRGCGYRFRPGCLESRQPACLEQIPIADMVQEVSRLVGC